MEIGWAECRKFLEPGKVWNTNRLVIVASKTQLAETLEHAIDMYYRDAQRVGQVLLGKWEGEAFLVCQAHEGKAVTQFAK